MQIHLSIYFYTRYFLASLCYKSDNAGMASVKLCFSCSLRFDQRYFAMQSITVQPSKTNKSLSLGVIPIVSDRSIHLHTPYMCIKRSYKTMLFVIARNVNTVWTNHSELPLNIHTRNIQTEHTTNTYSNRKQLQHVVYFAKIERICERCMFIVYSTRLIPRLSVSDVSPVRLTVSLYPVATNTVEIRKKIKQKGISKKIKKGAVKREEKKIS